MTDKIEGYLEVGHNDSGEVVINFPDRMKTDQLGRSHVVFSPDQARNLAKLMIKRANFIDAEVRKQKGRKT